MQNPIFARERNKVKDEESAHSTSMLVPCSASIRGCSSTVQSPCSLIYYELLFIPHSDRLELVLFSFSSALHSSPLAV